MLTVKNIINLSNSHSLAYYNQLSTLIIPHTTLTLNVLYSALFEWQYVLVFFSDTQRQLNYSAWKKFVI